MSRSTSVACVYILGADSNFMPYYTTGYYPAYLTSSMTALIEICQKYLALYHQLTECFYVYTELHAILPLMFNDLPMHQRTNKLKKEGDLLESSRAFALPRLFPPDVIYKAIFTGCYLLDACQICDLGNNTKHR